MTVLFNLLHIPLYYVLFVFAVIIVLGVIGMIALLIIRNVKPKVREDPALIKKWKRAFAFFAAFRCIPNFV